MRNRFLILAETLTINNRIENGSKRVGIGDSMFNFI